MNQQGAVHMPLPSGVYNAERQGERAPHQLVGRPPISKTMTLMDLCFVTFLLLSFHVHRACHARFCL